MPVTPCNRARQAFSRNSSGGCARRSTTASRARSVTKTDFARLESDKLTLIDTHAMDESVVTGNIVRVVENLCHDELQLLNRGIGHLLGQPDLETDRNPFAPVAIVEAFTKSLAEDQGGAERQVLDPQGAQSGVTVRDQRHLRRSQQAPAEPPRHAGRREPYDADPARRRQPSRQGGGRRGAGRADTPPAPLRKLRRKST